MHTLSVRRAIEPTDGRTTIDWVYISRRKDGRANFKTCENSSDADFNSRCRPTPRTDRKAERSEREQIPIAPLLDETARSPGRCPAATFRQKTFTRIAWPQLKAIQPHNLRTPKHKSRSNIANCGGRLKQKRSAFLFRHFHGGGGSDGIERDIDFPSTSSANGGARNRSTPTPPSSLSTSSECDAAAASMSIIAALFPFLLALSAWHMLATQQLLGGATAVARLPPQNNDESRSEVTIPIHFEAPFPSPSFVRRVLARLDRLSRYVKPPPLSGASADLEKGAQLRWAA